MEGGTLSSTRGRGTASCSDRKCSRSAPCHGRERTTAALFSLLGLQLCFGMKPGTQQDGFIYAKERVTSFALESSNFLETRCEQRLRMALELKGYTLKY